MSDDTQTPDGARPDTGKPQEPGDQTGDYTPPASQQELDRIIQDRLARERSKYADYDALKADAAKYRKAEEASKTELQKALDRATAAETALAANEAETLRLTVASEYGISGDYLDLLSGNDRAELESKAEKVAALITKDTGSQPPGPGPYVPTEGTGKPGSLQTTADKFAAAVSRQL